MDIENNETHCANCGTNCAPEEDYIVDGEYYCDGCYDDLFCTCDRCGVIVSRDSIGMVSGGDMDGDWCPYCVANHAYACHECGELTSNPVITDHGEYICESCCQANYDEDADWRLRVIRTMRQAWYRITFLARGGD